MIIPQTQEHVDVSNNFGAKHICLQAETQVQVFGSHLYPGRHIACILQMHLHVVGSRNLFDGHKSLHTASEWFIVKLKVRKFLCFC